MKNYQLGEFEEIVILTVGILNNEAYSVAIKDEIESRLTRTVSMGALHTALKRLEDKGYLKSYSGESTEERAGRPKRYFEITAMGKKAMQYAKATRDELWKAIPKTVLQINLSSIKISVDIGSFFKTFMKNDSNLKLAVPFFMVSTMETSMEFYVKLGFQQKMDWKPNGRTEWCWLKRENVAVMLQEYRKESLPTGKLGQGVTVCFICQDALKLYSEFLQKGLTPTEPFVGNKMWVVSLKDPDGYRLDFESSTDVAEETTYSHWLGKNKKDKN